MGNGNIQKLYKKGKVASTSSQKPKIKKLRGGAKIIKTKPAKKDHEK